MLVSIGTSRVKAIFLELTRQRDLTFDPATLRLKGQQTGYARFKITMSILGKNYSSTPYIPLFHRL